MYNVNDITRFSDDREVKDATTGRYAKCRYDTYRLDIVRDIGFVHTFIDGYSTQVTLPSHEAFKFVDDNGEHVVKADVNSVNVVGVTSFTFITK